MLMPEWKKVWKKNFFSPSVHLRLGFVLLAGGLKSTFTLALWQLVFQHVHSLKGFFFFHSHNGKMFQMNSYGLVILLFIKKALSLSICTQERKDIMVLHWRLHLHLSWQKKQRKGYISFWEPGGCDETAEHLSSMCVFVCVCMCACMCSLRSSGGWPGGRGGGMHLRGERALGQRRVFSGGKLLCRVWDREHELWRHGVLLQQRWQSLAQFKLNI